MTEPLNIGTRRELFVDDLLIDTMTGVDLKLHRPVKREVVLETNMPWESSTSAYFVVFRDGAQVRLYYRGGMPTHDTDNDQTTCLALSEDGIHFERPRLGLFEENGSKDNNIVWCGVEGHNLAPFRDTNPDARPDELYKAVGGAWKQLWALGSPDGVHWHRIQDDPIECEGTFDSLNVVHWDAEMGRYRMFCRHFRPFRRVPDGLTPENQCRVIQSTTSEDFIHWTPPAEYVYADGVPEEQFYTNATLPCPGAEHLLLSFPKRFVPERTKDPAHGSPGVSDAVFMTSRDGVHWSRRFLEAWVPPDGDLKNWTQRGNMPAWGIVTSPDEWSMYISEHYRHPTNRLRRLSIRPHGFASVHAARPGGEFVTHPLVFDGARLRLNYATSVVGSVRIEVQDANGRPIEGHTLADAPELFGDELDAAYSWASGPDVSSLAGRSVRLRIVLEDADLFALRGAD